MNENEAKRKKESTGANRIKTLTFLCLTEFIPVIVPTVPMIMSILCLVDSRTIQTKICNSYVALMGSTLFIILLSTSTSCTNLDIPGPNKGPFKF